MKRFVGVCLLLGLGVPVRGQDACASRNGDANADGILDVSDGITILAHLFLGSPGQLPELCPRASGLPDTSQVLCFDSEGNTIDCASAEWPGQDGHYRTGCPPEGRFVANGDGTVTDTCTGLVWQQRTADLDGDGQVTNGGGVFPVGPDVTTWQGALRYCEDLVFGGRSDWRLPNARELETIVDYTRRHPEAALDPVFDGTRRKRGLGLCARCAPRSDPYGRREPAGTLASYPLPSCWMVSP